MGPGHQGQGVLFNSFFGASLRGALRQFGVQHAARSAASAGHKRQARRGVVTYDDSRQQPDKQPTFPGGGSSMCKWPTKTTISCSHMAQQGGARNRT